MLTDLDNIYDNYIDTRDEYDGDSVEKIHSYTDNLVALVLSLDEKKTIVNNYPNGVFGAMNSYNNTYGEFILNTIDFDKNYDTLCYLVIQEWLYEVALDSSDDVSDMDEIDIDDMDEIDIAKLQIG